LIEVFDFLEGVGMVLFTVEIFAQVGVSEKRDSSVEETRRFHRRVNRGAAEFAENMN
jgi:hypothetical protein